MARTICFVYVCMLLFIACIVLPLFPTWVIKDCLYFGSRSNAIILYQPHFTFHFCETSHYCVCHSLFSFVIFLKLVIKKRLLLSTKRKIARNPLVCEYACWLLNSIIIEGPFLAKVMVLSFRKFGSFLPTYDISCAGKSEPQKLSTRSFCPLIVMKTITTSAASQLEWGMSLQIYKCCIRHINEINFWTSNINWLKLIIAILTNGYTFVTLKFMNRMKIDWCA